MQLEAREKKFLIVGSIVIVLLLAYLLWPSSGAPQSNVELVPADQRSSAAASPTPPVAAPVATPAPIPVQTVSAGPPPVAAAAAVGPGGIPQGMTLTGIAATGAIFAMADGSQRFVPRGREIAPGVTLQAVRLREVLLAAGGTNYRLGFGGVPIAVGAPSAIVASGPQPAANGSPAERQRVAGMRAEAAAIQAGLTPRTVGNRVSGYFVRSVGNPMLQRAGVQPGDLLLSVNGSELGPESLSELADTIQNSTRVEFEVMRAGDRLRLSVNPRG